MKVGVSSQLMISFLQHILLSKTNNLNNNINDGSNKSKPKIKTITNVQPISGLTYASVILQTDIKGMAIY